MMVDPPVVSSNPMIPSSVKSSQSKHLISGMIPSSNIISSAGSARNSIVNSISSQFKPNNELKNHLLNLSNNNAKSLQIAASLKS